MALHASTEPINVIMSSTEVPSLLASYITVPKLALFVYSLFLRLFLTNIFSPEKYLFPKLYFIF